jgi:hypothetical protein
LFVSLSTFTAGKRDWLINNKILCNFQSGFVKNKKKIVKIQRRDILRERERERERKAYLLIFGHLQNAFASIHRENLAYKTRKRIHCGCGWLVILDDGMCYGAQF